MLSSPLPTHPAAAWPILSFPLIAAPQPSDETAALIARVRQGDEVAARALVERLGPLVGRIANAYPALRGEFEDVVQDIFLRLFRKLGTYRGEAPLEHWAARAARFACIDRLRRLKVRRECRWSDLSPGERAFAEAADPGGGRSDAAPEDALALIDRLLATLRPIDAWLLRRIELDEQSVAEVAAEAGWTAGATHVRLFRARAKLRRALRDLESEPPTRIDDHEDESR